MRVTKAALTPFLAAALTLGLLTIWATTGRAGTPAKLSVTDGRVHLPTNPDATSAYFTIRNTGGSNDELVSVSTPVTTDVMLSFHTYTGYAGRMWMTEALPIPAHGLLGMTASGSNIMLGLPKTELRAGDHVTFTLRFRHSAPVTATAVVVAPGTWAPSGRT
ncbi:copper chaperone PCu(A)C [Streptomyces sp. SID3343]|nr:copper chaperone PCu(A)C [Streptomyces sp. SID3343]